MLKCICLVNRNVNFSRRILWSRVLKICANLTHHLKKIIFSQEFLERNRQTCTDFVRDRKLPFHHVVIFFLNFIKGSYQDELDNFFKTLSGKQIAQRIVSKAALCKARLKIKYEAFIELNGHLTDYFYENFNAKKWHNHRLVVFDASTIRLPHVKPMAKHFGVWGSTQGTPRPMARVSQMFDPINKISIDAVIAPKGKAERELAAQHCIKLQSDDLVLLDRGYPAFWLFKLILSQGADFCARLPVEKWKIAKKFVESGKKEESVAVEFTYASKEMCHKLSLDLEPIKLRLIRIELDTGETEVLVTSLKDRTCYKRSVFKELYHKRWPVEEDYKAIKCWLTVENFSGKSVLSIYQDFHAKIFSKNLTSVLATPAREFLSNTKEKKKYTYQINFAQAMSKTKHVLVLIFQKTRKGVMQLINELYKLYVRTIEPVRPGRKFPRNHKFHLRHHFMNYKPIA